MKRPARPVILASVRGRTVALRAVDNGSGFDLAAVRRLAIDAGLDPQGTTRSCYIGLSDLLDLEALAEFRNVVVQRVGRSS
jgi:hypothetical protein